MKEKIIQAALSLFQVYDLKKITMDDVARELSMSKRTLYQHFSHKEDLFRECVRYRVDQEGVFRHSDGSLLDVLLDYFYCFQKVPQTIDYERCNSMREHHRDIYHYLCEYLSVYAGLCKTKVPVGVGDGYVRKEVTPDMVYTFVLWHFSLLFGTEEYRSRSFSNDTMAGMVLAFMRGISTIKGRGYIDKRLKTTNK